MSSVTFAPRPKTEQQQEAHDRKRQQPKRRVARKSSGSGIQNEPDVDVDTVGAYLVFDKLGSGAFGEVFKGMHMVSGDMVAIKRMKSTTGRLVEREVDALTKAGDHHHCLSVYEIRDSDEEMFIVTDFCEGGDLYDYCFPPELSNNDGSIWVLEESEALDLFAQLILALEHVHNSGYVHGDVKLENIFMHSPEHIVLGDFGLATPFSKDSKRRANLATTHYCSPEAYLDLPVVGPESDIWAAGVVLFIMLHGRYPFYGDNKTEVMQSICGSTPKFDDDISRPVQDMIRRMLTKRPAQRITIEEIKALPVMCGVVEAVEEDCDGKELDWASAQFEASKVSRTLSSPVSKQDFSILARTTRVLDASIIPPEANPFLNGRETPIQTKTDLLKESQSETSTHNPFLKALLELQANFDVIVAESKAPPRRRASRCVSAGDQPNAINQEQRRLPRLCPSDEECQRRTDSPATAKLCHAQSVQG
mmetsp:Transcript_19498/g.74827  ORF Transcript_19498/g.74827 Transcript_19498/m.74827 type:complete len:477 (-) Transcript_19498:34-1464(-)